MLLCLVIFKMIAGTSLVAQWLRLRIPNAGGLGSIPGQGTRSHMPQLRPYAAKQINIKMIALNSQGGIINNVKNIFVIISLD